MKIIDTDNHEELLEKYSNLQQEYEKADNDRHDLFERIENALRMLNHIGLVMGRQLTQNEMSKLYSILKGDNNE